MFDTSREALAAEVLLHDAYNVSKNPLFANKAKQTSEWFNTEGVPKTEEHKEKIRQSNTGRKRTEETKRRLSLVRMGNKYNLGLKRGPHPLKGIPRGSMADQERMLSFFRSKRKKICIEVTSPSGITMCPLNIRFFCEEHGIDHSRLRHVARKQCGSHKGWTARMCSEDDG